MTPHPDLEAAARRKVMDLGVIVDTFEPGREPPLEALLEACETLDVDPPDELLWSLGMVR